MKQLNAGGGLAAARLLVPVIGGGGLIITHEVFCFVGEMRVIAGERGLMGKLVVGDFEWKTLLWR